ncbi:MAG: hypothetical protein J6S61_00745, partial [Elusimicrobiaceae bacterium]|nr:hypothetical protein [Elusimicrobiaceae bacterium]
MKKIFLQTVIFISAIISLSACFASPKDKAKPTLEYIEKKSFHDELLDQKDAGKKFWIAKETLVIQNNSDKDLQFKLKAHFPQDFKAGHIVSEELMGYSNSRCKLRVFTAKANSKSTFTVYFFGGELNNDSPKKYNRSPIPKKNLVIEPVSKSDMVNEYFAFFDYVLYGGDIEWQIGNRELYDKVEEEILSRAAAIMSGEELESFKSWFSIMIYFTQMINENIYPKISITEMSIEEGDTPLVMLTTNYNSPTKEIWDLASSHLPNLQEQIDAEWDYINEGIGGKWYSVFTAKEKQVFYFDSEN